jgi:hypothetical protein
LTHLRAICLVLDQPWLTRGFEDLRGMGVLDIGVW